MRFLTVVLGLVVVGCGTSSDDTFYCGPSGGDCAFAPDGSPRDASLADVRVNDATADPTADAGCGGRCTAGQICSYDPGCASPTKSCHPNTGGDAVALIYCGCDGHEIVTSQLFPTEPYEHAGHCAADGGRDANDDGG